MANNASKFKFISLKKVPKLLLDFMMLFLAVFLGFLADNYRENWQAQKEVNQQLFRLIDDLKHDEQLSESVLTDIKMRKPYFDSLKTDFPSYINGTFSHLQETLKFVESYDDFNPTLAAYSQLKNYGFRHIQDKKLVDSILSYYNTMEDVMTEHDNTAIKWRKMFDYKRHVFNYYKRDSLRTLKDFDSETIQTRTIMFPNSEQHLSAYYSQFSSYSTGLLRTNKNTLVYISKKRQHLLNMLESYLKE